MSVLLKKTYLNRHIEQLEALALAEDDPTQKRIYEALREDILPYADMEDKLQITLIEFVILVKHLLELPAPVQAERKRIINELLHK